MAKRNACPLCDAAPDPAYAPFCSRGCKDRDLLQWLGEGYRLPGERADPATDFDAQSGLDTPGNRD